ncbi:MAG: hypothetical protein NDJ75_10130 [Thermoanaerobaculia bacterium]|nr:hypothetical protein [Thermoanaerobaculia bacterium]
MSRAAPLLPVAGAAGRQRQRRIAFFFDDYLDPASRILELAPAAASLEAYLKEAGFHRYTRLAAAPPADVVGDVRDWRALGLAPASFDVVIALDALDWNGDEAACRDLLAPGGTLFATAPIPGRGAVARLLATLGMAPRRRRAAADLARVAGFATLALRRHGFVEQWARLRKPLDG